MGQEAQTNRSTDAHHIATLGQPRRSTCPLPYGIIIVSREVRRSRVDSAEWEKQQAIRNRGRRPLLRAAGQENYACAAVKSVLMGDGSGV